MKTITIKCMLLTICIISSLCLQAQEATFTANVETPGTLSALIPASKKYQITNMKVIGRLNGADIDYIRDMAGVARALKPIRDYSYGVVYAYEDSVTDGKLAVLDLSKTIIMDGSSYLIHGNKEIHENGNKYSREEYYQTKGDNCIGDFMFSGCIRLTSVTIPDNLSAVGIEAFSGCTNLTDLTSSEVNKRFSCMDGVLFNKSKTELIACIAPKSVSYTVPGSVSSIARYAFSGCKGLTSVTIPNSVASIGTNAFKGCSSLNEMIIEDGKNQLLMGDYGAKYSTIIDFIFTDTPLERVYIGRKMSNNDSGCSPFAFFKKSLKMATLGEGITSIGSNAFLGCAGLSSIKIPQSVTSIGSQAFYSCSGLLSVALPKGVSYIGGNAFSDCTGLTSIIIPDSVMSIKSGTFANCTSLSSMSIPVKVTFIAENAFAGCSRLKSVSMGDSIKFIMSGAFSGCTGLKEFIVSKENPRYTVVDGVLFNKERTQLFSYPNARSATYAIPEGVTFIADQSFSGCTKLTAVSLPNSLRSIGSQSFNGCTSLTSVVIPGNVTAIGLKSFANCSGLMKVTIGPKVNSIFCDAFSGCSELKEFVVIAGNTNYCSVDGVLFNAKKNILIAYPNARSGVYTIPSSVTYIGEDALAGCTGLKELHCLSMAPPVVYASSFKGMDKALCKLYVPKGGGVFYSSADNWGFANIIEE